MTISKLVIRLFAVLFAAGFMSQNAAAFGFFINPSGGAFYIFADYGTADAAENAAREFCRNAQPDDAAACDREDPARMLSFMDDEVLAFNRSGFEGTGGTRQAAYDVLFQECRDAGLSEDNCNNVASMANTRFCGDGTAADLIDTTFPNADECTMRLPTSAADCPNEFFNNAVSPARCDPLPNCDTATTELNTGTNMCDCLDETPERVDATSCRPITAADCGQNERPDFWNGSMCVADCGEGFANPTNTGETCIAETPPTCEEHETINSSTNMCVDRTAENCGNGEVFSPVNTGGVCQTPAIFLAGNATLISPTYTAASCRRAEWMVSIAINNEKTAAAEVCGIPVVRNDSARAAIASAAESAPLQFDENDPANGCIIRESSDFSDLPDCGDPQLFGDGGFPQMPENFDVANDRLMIAVLSDGSTQIFFGGTEVLRDVATDSSQIARSSSGNGSGGKFILSGIGLFWAVYSWKNGAGEFNFSPDVGYAFTESGYSANAAGQLNFRDENLHIYWRAGQQNANGNFGDLRYESGGKYTADFWTATFSESISGETANYDFSLSADLRGGIWQISPTYRMQSEWKESDSGIKTDTQNELNLQGDFRYNNWQIRPSAGFQWQNFSDFANSGKLQINAIHRF